MTSVRQAALAVLVAVESGHTTLAAEIEQARKGLTDDRDRGLLLELANGTLRWRAELDALLAPCSTRPFGEIDPVLRSILRLTVYQLEHLTRVPAHAALNEAVELARLAGHPKAAGFVNAVLRAFGRRRKQLNLPARPAQDGDRASQLAYLSITLSHPEWLAARWLDRYGFEPAERWCRFNNSPPEVTIRTSARMGGSPDLLAALRAADLDAQPAPFVTHAIRLSPGALGRISPDLRAGLVVQEEASQIVAHSVGAQPGESVLDLCAAPGGKTMVLASDMNNQGRLVAGDLRPARLRLLRAILREAAVRAPVVRFDATRPLPFPRSFDRVLLDAPCSGLGTLRLNPDLKWIRSSSDLAGFANTQLLMLKHAAEVVLPAGTLIYATCSSEPEENDNVLAAFLSRERRFERRPVEPGASVRSGACLVDRDGYLRTIPFRDGLDAFFAARLVRRADA
jgi:16S rRNA (cytosine967-C5)-methyltransferase